MGAVQRLATMVIVGLVALSTILVLYVADESNRIQAEEHRQQEAAIERATDNYISLCMSCHGPAGLGYTEPSERGTGRVGAALGGINASLNQEGINAAGTPISGGVQARANRISTVIHEGLLNPDGSYRMPPWSETLGGPLNDRQIEELVIMIQNVDWNYVYNEAILYADGYPTPPPAAAPPVQETPAPEPAVPGVYNVDMVDIAFAPTELVVPANTEITINLSNSGAAVHNFHIDELDVDSGDYAPGQTGSITFNTGAPAEYEFYCSVPGHREAGMVGTFIVTDDPALLETEEASTEAPAEDEPESDADNGAASVETLFDVDMVDIAFAPTELVVPANTEITIELTNSGAAVHNFLIDELDVDSGDYAGGQSGSITFNTGEPGEYEFYCSVPGHREAGMVGTLIVE